MQFFITDFFTVKPHSINDIFEKFRSHQVLKKSSNINTLLLCSLMDGFYCARNATFNLMQLQAPLQSVSPQMASRQTSSRPASDSATSLVRFDNGF